MWQRIGIMVVGLSLLTASAAAQPTASDWVRDDRVFSMGGLYTHRAWSVDAGDIDGDGIDDMVFTTQDGKVEIYRGTGLPGDDAWERRLEWSGDIQLEVPTEPEEEWATRWFVAVTDLNGNGRPELFLTCGDSPDPPLCLERSVSLC
ncbi:VCBS repeat-containing protein [Candidatus Fermentibacteria bacterium]|nr:VCBS repeat-containing protein [Candidatus Fermentibacteria bacterium]